jgi:ribosomal protein S18 acetylase RimI-like enzyme
MSAVTVEQCGIQVPVYETSNIVIREATLNDLSTLQHIEQRCFTSDRLSARRIKFYIEAKHAELFIASSLDGKEVFGYGLLLLRRGTQLTRLYSLAVLPEARGNGVAQTLIEKLGERAFSRGKRYMRLEVSADNHGAINLYRKLGFKDFGVYSDYYEDHTDAIRMQKVLVSKNGRHLASYPWYQQTTAFTCGPSALMMAMQSLDSDYVMKQEEELSIWRMATTIFMMAGHGGCHPIGLALAAKERGFDAHVVINNALPLFTDGVRGEHKKSVVTLVESEFALQAEASNIRVDIGSWGVELIEQQLLSGCAVLCLISTYSLDKKKVPHWVTVTGFDEYCFYIHDPDASDEDILEFQHIPVAREDFMRLASYGKRKSSALVIIASS